MRNTTQIHVMVTALISLVLFIVVLTCHVQYNKIVRINKTVTKLHSRLESATFTIVAYWKDNEDKAERIAELEKLLHSMQDVIPEEHE